MCAALSSYVRACAAKGILLNGWRNKVCSKLYTPLPLENNHPKDPANKLSEHMGFPEISKLC